MDVECPAPPRFANNNATRADSTDVPLLAHAVTPQRIAPNVGRRRQGTPALFRAEPSPSHCARMASIFENAAADIQLSRRPLPQYCMDSSSISSTQITRGSPFLYPKGTPLLPPQSVPTSGASSSLSSTHGFSLPPEVDRPLDMPPLPPPRISTSITVNIVGQEPLSSGFTSPTTATNRICMDKAIYPRLLASYLEDEECHSTHGVPYIMPTPTPVSTQPVQMRDIDAWLDELMDPTPDPVPKPTYSPKVISGRLALPVQSRGPPGSSLFQRKLRSATPSAPPRNPQVEILTASRQSSYSYAVFNELGRLAPPEANCKLVSMAPQSSNKENLPPPTISLSWSSITSSSAPLSPNCPDQVNSSPETPLITITKPAVPYSFQNPPPHSSTAPLPCKKLRPSFPWPSPLFKGPVRKPFKDARFGIREDEVAGEDVPTETGDIAGDYVHISPDVQRHRKGKGPRRDRRPSYWDEDIVPGPSPR